MRHHQAGASERDRATIRGSEATVRHRAGASEAMRNIGSEGAKRPKQSERSERRVYTHHRTEGAKRPCAVIGQERAKRAIITYLGYERDLCIQ